MLERTSEGLLDMWVVLEAALRTSGRLGRIVGLSIFEFAAGSDDFFFALHSRLG